MVTKEKAGAPKKGSTKLVRVRVSSRLYAYLTFLKNETMLGKSENDVVVYLLTQRLERMRQSNYRDKELPTPRAGSGSTSSAN